MTLPETGFGNPIPKIPLKPWSLKLVFVVSIPATAWSDTDRPATLTLAVPICPDAKVGWAESPYFISTASPIPCRSESSNLEALSIDSPHDSGEQAVEMAQRSDEPVSVILAHQHRHANDLNLASSPKITGTVLEPTVICIEYSLAHSSVPISSFESQNFRFTYRQNHPSQSPRSDCLSEVKSWACYEPEAFG